MVDGVVAGILMCMPGDGDLIAVWCIAVLDGCDLKDLSGSGRNKVANTGSRPGSNVGASEATSRRGAGKPDWTSLICNR